MPPPATQRIVALDFLRGLMMVIMMLNHLTYFPLISILGEVSPFTFQPLGFVTAAEGFFFLSGLLLAWVYTPHYQRNGIGAFDARMLNRGMIIYAHYLFTYAFVVALFLIPWFAEHWPYNWDSQEAIKNAPFAMLLRAAVFTHQTGLLDILPLYVFFCAFTLWVMRELTAARPMRVLVVCVALWAIAQARPQLAIEQFAAVQLGWFEVLAWQLIFVAGFALGYYRRIDQNFRIPIRRDWLVFAACICAPLFFYRHYVNANAPAAIAALIDARNLGVIRLINTAALGYLIYALYQSRPHWFRARFFCGIGRYAIDVFVWHIMLCYALMPLRPHLAQLALPINIALWLALTASLYLPVWLRERLSSNRASARR